MQSDIFDLIECFKVVSEIIQKERGNEIYINLSAGTNVMGVAGFMAALMWQANAYYVIPEKFTPPKEPLNTGVKEIYELPQVFNVSKPKKEWLTILQFIKSRGGSTKKKQLIDYLKEEGMIAVPDSAVKSERQSAHRQLENIIVKMRDNAGLVSEEGKAKAKRIRLTSKGDMTLNLFDFLVRDKQ